MAKLFNREWLTSHFSYDVAKFLFWAFVGLLFFGFGGAHLLNVFLSPEHTVTASSIILVVTGLIILLWVFGLVRIPKRTKPEPQEPILMVLIGPGPILYVDPVPGRIFTVENINILMFNLFSFPIEFSNMQTDIFIDDKPLTIMSVNIGAQIPSNNTYVASLRHGLMDNQAQTAREYRDQYSCCPLLQIRGTAYFRMPQGTLLSVPINGAIRCFIHKM